MEGRGRGGMPQPETEGTALSSRTLYMALQGISRYLFCPPIWTVLRWVSRPRMQEVCGSQSVAPGPAASVSLVGMQILGSHPRPPESEALQWSPSMASPSRDSDDGQRVRSPAPSDSRRGFFFFSSAFDSLQPQKLWPELTRLPVSHSYQIRPSE